jgi:anti-anti-sigma factor
MSVAQSWQKSRTAQFTTRLGSAATVITAHGELDAANAGQLTDYVERSSRHSQRLTLDLRGLEFFGTAGFSALHRINVACSAAGIQWALVPGPAVCRVLRICDPDGTLPTSTSLVELLTEDGLQPVRRGLLKLVPQSR